MSTRFEQAARAVRDGSTAEQEAQALYDQMTDEERLWLLDGDTPFWEGQTNMLTEGYNVRPIVHGHVERLGIPGLRFSDGPRGVVMGHSTAFPVSVARGATWDPALEERVGEAIGEEVAAQGGNFFAGVCINLLRHPAWGRAQETYGEDPVLLGEMGAALTRGVRRHVMACAKHFALNSMENVRLKVNVRADDAALHEVYLPHFRRVVEEGVDGIMSAYNKVNGSWCGHSKMLLTDTLRTRWGFKGVTVSDFVFGIRDAADSLEAGLDVEEPFRQIRGEHLQEALDDGRTSWGAVHRSCLSILSTQLRFAAEHLDEDTPSPKVVAGPEHTALAREVATRAVVLLRNEKVDGTPVLPLDASGLRRLAVIGRLADVANTGDHGSSDVRAPYVVTPLQGLREALPNVEIIHVPDDDPQAAAAAAAGCDAAVVVAGYTAADEGEFADPNSFGSDLDDLFPSPPGDDDGPHQASMAGAEAIGAGGDRERLTLRPVDEAIIRAVGAANPRTVVAVITAGAVLTESWKKTVPGILVSWYAGMEGGRALADILLGAANPSGRLPYAVPTSEEHLPFFDRDATEITYDRWHGQRLLDRLGVDAAYPLGFGLSYTGFELADASVSRTGAETARVDVEVRNTGGRDGRHVVQVYGVRPGIGDRHLLGFAGVDVPARESRRVTVMASLRPLRTWSADADDLLPAVGTVSLTVAAHAADPSALSLELAL
ncbi:Hypothetical protein ACGLYG10_0101 [Actinomyces glycerinitolerans]|uniref:Fibronectin type III-like domain-containing protein n=2 Tax=Actinomyces glycerinitolerans TaxID=1892869 RepID=A0A1M4RVA3_9ACTO|nr:Hypothetical protein ACGLYG10_0101 [Actinomyces glycerinitolerans]